LAAQRFRLLQKVNDLQVEEPGDPYPSEERQRLTRLVLRALAEDLVTESRAAELLGRPLGEFTSTKGAKHAGFPVGVRG
jgi:hypothetical protein